MVLIHTEYTVAWRLSTEIIERLCTALLQYVENGRLIMSYNETHMSFPANKMSVRKNLADPETSYTVAV